MASTSLNRTTWGTPTSKKKFTISFWFKNCKADKPDEEILFSSQANPYDGGNRLHISIDGGEQLKIEQNTGSYTFQMKTSRVFRDVSGWTHAVFKVDTTQATEADRFKLYINGVAETSWSTSTMPAQDLECRVPETGRHAFVGSWSGSGQFWDGLLSHYYYTDGYAYDASTFGETDSTTGEWKIKTSPSVSYGTNGFLILKDGNTITDQSSNSNDFSLQAGTLTNTEDCPSNVFCTLNPLNNTVSGTAPVFSNGNNTVVTGTSAADFGGSGTFGLKKGVWYYEGLVVTSGNDNLRSIFGITSNPAETARNNQEIYYNRYSYSWKGYNGGWWVNTNATNGNGTETASHFNTYTNGDYIGIYFDLDNNKIAFTKNGTLERSGVSDSITAVGSTDTGFYFPIYTDGHSAWSSSAKLNFGNGSFGTTSLTGSENSDWFRDAGGMGKFKYNPTQTIDSTTWNARAICTKNINAYG